MNYFTGYHATTEKEGNNILKSKKFKLSISDKNWLGDGIYFYPKYEDALNWNRGCKGDYAEAIIHAIVCVEDGEYIDFDEIESRRELAKIKNFLKINYPVTIKKLEEDGTLSLQCFVSNWIWENMKDVKVQAATFHTTRTIFSTLIDEREERKEFCVRDNIFIKQINKIDVVLP